YSTAGGDDRAVLYDSALEAFPDYLEADASWARLSNDALGYAYMVWEFESVTANSSNESDVASVDPTTLDFLLEMDGW
ncbi:MAG: hypothetical protein ABIP48_24425, partial [Planctomycetota bacterium]